MTEIKINKVVYEINEDEAIVTDCDIDNEIWVFINDNDGSGVWGVGYIYTTDECELPYRAEMHQPRIDVSSASFSEAFDILAEGKLYVADCKNAVDSLNTILDFWFDGPEEKLPEVYVFENYEELEVFLRKPFPERYFLAKVKEDIL